LNSWDDVIVSTHRTPAGHIGLPRFANPEKGETLLGQFSLGVVDFVRRMAAWDGHSWL